MGMVMKIDEIKTKYPVLSDAVERIKEVDKIDTLFPPQVDAIKSGYLEGKNLVLATPTCSGKTIISETAMLKTILEKGKKAIYLVPLKALAMEKYREFKEKYEPLGVKVAVSIGDYDSAEGWLANFDIIVMSNEKCDSLLRHDSPWFGDVGIIVADEIHMIDDVGRGPTLEIVLTKLRELTSAQILALSATIHNSSEIAEWLNAELVESDFRPTRLYEGVCCEGIVDFPKQRKNNFALKRDVEGSVELSEHIFREGKQSLVFVSTKKSTEAEARRIAGKIGGHLKPEERSRLSKLAIEVEKALEHPTKQCKKLANAVRSGVAFHNSGLAHKQKVLIEDAFRSGLLKSIACTTTLAYGINLPSDYCIMRDVKRYYPAKGYDFIPVLEYKQCAGRAGRIKYSSEGRVVVVAKKKNEYKKIVKRFILGEPEDIKSKLGVEPVLRMHTLALIASGVTTTRKELMGFFSKTFYAYQYGDLTELQNKIEKILLLLKGFGFINIEDGEENQYFKKASVAEKDSVLSPTRIGKRVAELYIDPLSADHLIRSLKILDKKGVGDFSLLHIISECIEMKPLPSVRTGDWKQLNEVLVEKGSCLLDAPNEWDLEYDDFIRAVKNAHILSRWVEEDGEDKLLERFGITPGELRVRLDNADWLLYSAQELALLLNLMAILKDIRKLRLRIKYGIKAELLPLVKLKGVGRVKARKLWQSNIRSLGDLRKVPIQSLGRIIGTKTARSVKEQLGEKN
jgi:helicase